MARLVTMNPGRSGHYLHDVRLHCPAKALGANLP